MRSTHPPLFISLCAAVLALPLAAQDAKVLTVDDYAKWNRISSTALSDNGNWFAHVLQPNEGDGTLQIRHIDDPERNHEVAVGSNPSFSDDSQWAAYFVSPPDKEAKKLRKAKKPVTRKAVLLALESGGDEHTVENASRITFAKGSKYVAIHKQKPSSQKHGGADLLLRNLATGRTTNLGNVGRFAFNDGGTMLSYTVDAADRHGNGLYLFVLESGVLRALDSGTDDYAQLTWSEDGHHLAALRGDKPEKKTERENVIVAISEVGTGREQTTTWDPSGNLPAGMLVSERGSLSWSEDGRMLSFGIQSQSDELEKDDERPNVDVWHWRDDRAQSVQARRAERDRNRTVPCALHLPEARFVQLGEDDLRVRPNTKGRWAIGRTTTPYAGEVTWGGGRADYYRIDQKTGERALITKSLRRTLGSSPDGRWFVYLKGGVVWSCDLDTNESHNLSKAAPVEFVNVDDDHPFAEKPAWGVAGWSSDGRSVILNHRFDLWQCTLDGAEASCLTSGLGDAEGIRFRYVRLDPDEESIDLSAPMLLSAYGEWTKESGFYRLMAGESPSPLRFVDRRMGRPRKAKDADRVVLTMETFEEFPDYWATSTAFAEPVKITDANPQQAEYGWGRRVLMDYENARGVQLQATVTLPAGYQEGRRYPMLVYFYEKMSQRHHQYSMPRFDDRPQMSTYASDGYVVLMPDVVYLDGRPGDCAVDCVTSAAKKAIELGYADPERIALQGHSWGGYQSSFILTQTDMFCAVVTGAPVTNLISFYGELYKSSGTIQQGIVEVGQVRMGTTPFENLELFRSQSPWHHVESIETPFIILHGTDDGSVDWQQGLEFYAAARRVGKQVILLSYPGEGHHLGKRPNQIDFQVRMKQFFDHYCKGTPAPAWMVDGVPYLEKDRSSPRPKPKPDDVAKPGGTPGSSDEGARDERKRR